MGRTRLRVPSPIRWVAIALFLGLVAVALTWRLFVRPATGIPQRADAAIVLSGTWATRLAIGERLLRTGVVSSLVFVGTPDSPAAERLCAQAESLEEVICLRPMPDSTRTEVRSAAELAEEKDWSSVVLVTSTHHVTRAGMLLRRCYAGKVSVVGADLPAGINLTPRVFAKEWAGLLRDAIVDRGC